MTIETITPGIFDARFASSCLCGQWVSKGDPIAFCAMMRRVTMCPACRPVKSDTTCGAAIAVNVAGLDLTVASLRSEGKFVGLSFRSADEDLCYAFATYRVVGGRWVCVDSFSSDAADSLTNSEVNDAVQQARNAHRMAA